MTHQSTFNVTFENSTINDSLSARLAYIKDEIGSSKRKAHFTAELIRCKKQLLVVLLEKGDPSQCLVEMEGIIAAEEQYAVEYEKKLAANENEKRKRQNEKGFYEDLESLYQRKIQDLLEELQEKEATLQQLQALSPEKKENTSQGRQEMQTIKSKLMKKLTSQKLRKLELLRARRTVEGNLLSLQQYLEQEGRGEFDLIKAHNMLYQPGVKGGLLLKQEEEEFRVERKGLEGLSLKRLNEIYPIARHKFMEESASYLKQAKKLKFLTELNARIIRSVQEARQSEKKLAAKHKEALARRDQARRRLVLQQWGQE